MAFMGMRGTGDWVANQRPENWRQMFLRLYPNGSAPLTAIMSMLGSESVDDPHFHWWNKGFPAQAGVVTNVYTDPALSSAYTSGGVAGTILYVKVSQALATEFRRNHTVKLTKSGDHNYDTVGLVRDVVLAGASSYIVVKLLEAANATYDLDEVDWVDIIGNGAPEGDDIPDSIGYDPTERSNYTQIFRTALDITRTARLSRLRTPQQYEEAKRECLELHAIEMEKTSLWGIYAQITGDNGKPMRFTRGVVKAITEYASGNVANYTSDSDYSGQSWLQGGEDWFNRKLATIYSKGDSEKMAFAGTEAILALDALAKAGAQINIRVMQASYGIRVAEWVHPFGTLYLKTHPLFSQHANHSNHVLILEPRMLRYRYITDTMFKDDQSEERNTNNSRDGTNEEYITEAGIEHHNEEVCGLLTGLGTTNTA